MPREAFEREMQRLEDDMLVLGSMVETAVLESVELLKRRDTEGAKRIIANDLRINEKRFAIEEDALVLIATQQPLASDLRTLAAILAIITELERIGDYAKGISKISIMLGNEPLMKPLVDIPRMATMGMDLLRRSLQAFIHCDVEQARAIPMEDDELDALYNQVYRELLTYIIADPKNLNQANLLLWAAHNLERAGDRVTNICERVIFMVTGEMKEMDAEMTESAGPEAF